MADSYNSISDTDGYIVAYKC